MVLASTGVRPHERQAVHRSPMGRSQTLALPRRGATTRAAVLDLLAALGAIMPPTAAA